MTGEKPGLVEVTLKDLESSYQESITTYPGRAFSFTKVPYSLHYRLSAYLKDCTICEESSLDFDVGTMERGSITIRLNSAADPKSGAPTVSLESLQIPKSAISHWKKARAEVGKKNLEKAVEHLERACKAYPQFVEGQNERALLLMQLNKSREAAEAFGRALEIDQNDFTASKYLGYLRLTSGDPQGAVELLQRAAATAPDDAESLGFLGEALFQAGRSGEAVAPLKRSLEVNPANYRASYRLGYVYLGLKEYRASLDSFRQFLEHNNGALSEAKVVGLVGQLEAALSQ